MAENDKKLQNSQNQTDSQIKTNTKNKYKTLQIIEIINSIKGTALVYSSKRGLWLILKGTGSFKKDVTEGGGGGGYPKMVTNSDIGGRGVYSNGDVTAVFFQH